MLELCEPDLRCYVKEAAIAIRETLGLPADADDPASPAGTGAAADEARSWIDADDDE